IVPVLIEAGTYTYPYMGAAFDSEVSLTEAEVFGLSQTRGAYMLDVVPGGPAEQAGLIAADPETGEGGDLIIALDGQPVRDFNDLNSYLVFNTQPGQTIEVTVLRGGEEVTVDLTLGERP
ncbi:MAG: PDZ domain-containing protein, partial [Chloroflexi bacterium]|nr:PDZ domain-containing protein [Chloroflexota bacterium]